MTASVLSSSNGDPRAIKRLETGIEGLDLITQGGLCRDRATLLAGSAGSGKTVFGAQFLASGIEAGEPGVFVTFEEPLADIRANMLSLGWDIEAWESAGKWSFVDVSIDPESEPLVTGDYDLDALMARISHAIEHVGAGRVVLDSVGGLFSQLPDTEQVRRQLLKILTRLKKLGVTSLLTIENPHESDGAIGRFGIEEFVADGVLVLRNAMEDEKRRRTIEVLKMRGVQHQKGEYPFTIVPQRGVVILPMSTVELSSSSSTKRITLGTAELDEMCGGGVFADTTILVSGATGTGKTLTATQFLGAGAANGERTLLFAFEESREQMFRNAVGWGVDFPAMERAGNLVVVSAYPGGAGLEDHLIKIREMSDTFRPHRIAVDSLSALEHSSTERSFREFVGGVTALMKSRGICSLFTATTPGLLGGTSITEAHISTITDMIVLLRYVERRGEMHRAITILKMRGSEHDKLIRDFHIDSSGIHIGGPITDVDGIVGGSPVYKSSAASR